jgi:hypothetical protein
MLPFFWLKKFVMLGLRKLGSGQLEYISFVALLNFSDTKPNKNKHNTKQTHEKNYPKMLNQQPPNTTSFHQNHGNPY